MKSDHRHELKTNELADWMAHFPDWARENRNNLIAVGAIVYALPAALATYLWPEVCLVQSVPFTAFLVVGAVLLGRPPGPSQ